MCLCDRPFGIIRQTWRDFEADITVTPVRGDIHSLQNVCRLCDILHGDAGVDVFGRRAVPGEVGDFFVTQDREPVFEIVRDDVGVHDLFFSACSPALYAQRFDAPEHRSCRMNLFEALQPYGVVDPLDVPDPINIFMDSPPLPSGEFEIREAPSKPGDRIVLRCLRDSIVAVSACPFDFGPLNAGKSIDKLSAAVGQTGAEVVGGLEIKRNYIDQHTDLFVERLLGVTESA